MPRRATATATSGRVQCGTLAVLLVLLQAAPPLGLLLAGGPAGAAAQALPPVGPPAPLAAAPREASAPEAVGKAKKLAECAIVRVLSGKTCKVKKGGKTLLVKDPVVTVLKDGEEEPPELGPNRFAKQFAETYSPGAGPTADVTFAGQPVVAAALDGLAFKKPKSGTGKLKAKVAPSDRAALAALDPATDRCEVVFETPCGEVGEIYFCIYGDKACAVGANCPGGTLVSAECADRSAFKENPCVCTALQELAALSSELQGDTPWNDLANKAYCQDDGVLAVVCTSVGLGLPTYVSTKYAQFSGPGLAGALPPSVGDLGPSLTVLELPYNAITAVPPELADLAALTYLDLSKNQLTGVPAEFRTWGPTGICRLFNNPGFSCANVGVGTSCCTADNCPNGGTSACYQG